MNIVNLAQGTPEWHGWRATRRMASESPALLGLSPWAPKTPLQLYEVKTGLTHIEQSPAMLHGIVNEGRARDLYETDRCTLMVPHVVEDEDGYGASLDGFSQNGRRILEIKCPVKGSDSSLWKWCAAVGAVIPEHYHAQVQHQLMVSGAEACDFLVYAADIDKFVTAEILPDPGRQLSIRFAWDAFWPYFESQTPPEPVEGDYVERFDAEWASAEGHYLVAKAALKAAEAREEQHRKALLDLAGDASCRGEALRVTRYHAKGAVDYGKVPELRGVDLDGFRKKGSYRHRITLL